MADINLDISRFRGWARVNKIVAYLNELRAGVPESDVPICQALLDAVEQDLITTDIFGIFIPWSKSPLVIAKCLNYESNTSIRSYAIKELGKHLRRPARFNWELTWKALGGTEALVQIFSRSSVAEIKKLSMFIGCCNRGRKVEEREQRIEELLRALLPGVYTSPPQMQSKDRRPVQHHYARMLSACSPSFINDVLNKHDSSNPLFASRDLTRLVKSHRALFRERATKHLFGSGPKDEDVARYLDNFLYSDRDFAKKALQGRLDSTVTDQRWGYQSEISILMPVIDRLDKTSRHSDEVKLQIHDLIKLGLEILDKNRGKHRHDANSLWTRTLSGWQNWPDQYEDALRLALRLGLAELPHKDPRSYLDILSSLQPERRERLLRFCYLDIPHRGIDLFSADDYRDFAKQTWPAELFRLLTPEQAIRLLKKLYEANAEYNFLEPPAGPSILMTRHVGSQDNFNVDLYLTMLQRDDQKVQTSAREAVDKLRKKASAAREQADRATSAKAAASYAIATGSLEIYGETIVWQQRFVRDPLTVKSIFAHHVVRTDEGVELLSGVPTPETLAETCKDNIPLLLDEISREIKSADAVLRTLQETYLLAKREPSFQEQDWTHVKGLFTAALNSRMSRSKALQNHFEVPSSEIDQVIWTGLLAAFEWMDAEFIRNIQAPVQELLQRCKSRFLAAATKSLLDVGSERRRRRDAQDAAKQGTPKSTAVSDKPAVVAPPGFPGAAAKKSAPEDESLEQMSYHALMRLASSDMPALASPLILQTILDRPDASSWHRMLLSVGLLKNLRAEEAHKLLMGLAKGIGEKLEEQSYVRVGESEPPKHAPSQPAVKVTTVKYLAQLLNNAEFISNDAAVEVLIELFRAAQHRDIRLAALESLLSLLDSACTGTQEEMKANPTIRKIMTALETVVPVAGSINERRPPRPQDWAEAEAEATGVLPELSDVLPGDLPPLMEAVVTAANRPGLKKLKDEFVERLVLPVLELSQKEHTRWVNLFLAKHQATALTKDVPETPMEPRLWTTVFSSCYSSISKKYLSAFNTYAIHRIAPAPALKQFNASLRANVELRKNVEVQHWLQTFDRGIGNFRSSDTNTLFELLDHQQKTLGECGVFLTMIAQHASLYLDEYEKYTSVWEDFVNSLSPTSKIMEEETSYRAWHDNRRAISAQVIDMIRRKKQQRQRLLLPSTTKMEFWLLMSRGWSKEDGKCRGLVSKFEDCLLAMLNEYNGSALRWPEIARVACEMIPAVLTKDSERLRVVEHMGDIRHAVQASNDSSAQLGLALDLIKLEVVLALIDKCRKKETDEFVARRVKEWRAYDSDAVRERVFQWEKRRGK
ncbi:hypothetical protein diail_10452 [Diaporthe ilicicola]|nr:hypothetical protein diail_10452 [Diaporthe ilicicola]